MYFCIFAIFRLNYVTTNYGLPFHMPTAQLQAVKFLKHAGKLSNIFSIGKLKICTKLLQAAADKQSSNSEAALNA